MVRSLLKRCWYLLALALVGSRVLDSAAKGDWLATAFIFCAVLGMAMNVIVIILNDGMPAGAKLEEIPEGERSRYKQIDDSTRLPLLADWIPVRDLLISPGDVIIALGVVGILARALL